MSEQPSKKETVGKLALDLQQQIPDTTDPIEIEREAHKDYADNVFNCLADGKKVYPQSDFYIVVETKKERLLTNVLRNYFFHRRSCPTPNFDQTVYKYTWNNDHLSFLWVVPSKDTCKLFKDNVLRIASEERDLLKYVLDFEDGTLLKLAKELNNEQIDSNLIN
jgi:hypothetical protein